MTAQYALINRELLFKPGLARRFTGGTLQGVESFTSVMGPLRYQIIMTRFNTKIGDVFCVKLDDSKKKYFQYIISDVTQLNSDVIRAFKKEYPMDANPDLSEIVNGDVEFYAHCVTKLGLKMKLWESVGNTDQIGATKEILFRDTNDYGSKVGEEPIKISQKWYVWRINDKKFTHVGKLDGENRKAFVGIVMNPLGIIELLKGNIYPVNYPKF